MPNNSSKGHLPYRCYTLLLYIIFLSMYLCFISVKNFYIFSVWRDFRNESPIDKLGVGIEIVWHEIRPKIITSFLFLITFPQFYISDIWEHLPIQIKRNSLVSQKRSGWWHDHHCLNMWESGKTQMAYVHLEVMFIYGVACIKPNVTETLFLT